MARYETPEELRIVLGGLFTTRLRGREAALTLAQLCLRRDLRRYRPREIRLAIAELVEHDGLPICGDCTAGYYLAETAAERLAQLRQLGGRLSHIGRRFRTFARVSAAGIGGQLQLDFTESPARLEAQRRSIDRVLDALASMVVGEECDGDLA